MARSGLIDVELFAQYLVVCHAHDHPEILDTSTAATSTRSAVLEYWRHRTPNGSLNALVLWHALQGFLSLTVFGNMTAEREAKIPVALKADQVRISGAVNFQALAD